MSATKLVRRETRRDSFREAQTAKEYLREQGYIVRSFAMDDEAGNYWLIIFERDEPVVINDSCHL